MFETETLAIWGAITGSVGTIAGLINLWIRLKQHRFSRSHGLRGNAYYKIT